MRFRDFGTVSQTILRDGPVSVSSTVPSDSENIKRIELANKDYLDPWRTIPANMDSSESKIFTVRHDSKIVGQVILFNFQIHDNLKSCSISYWIESSMSGKNIGTSAVQLVIEHAFSELGVHEVDATIQPENTASIRVIEKLKYHNRDMIGEGKVIGDRWQNFTLYTVTRNLKDANL